MQQIKIIEKFHFYFNAMSSKHPRTKSFLNLHVFPLFLYCVIFCMLTFPALTQFSTHIFADSGDGLQNYWNIWWVNKSITELHKSPWFTTYLHFPHGVTLISHTLNIINGLTGIFLLKFLTLIETYNTIIMLAFTLGGYTAFQLSYYFTKNYAASICAGYIFTFSQFHFGHAEGHMQLVSLQWVPLFILYWWQFLEKPRIKQAIFSAIALFLVLLCDYYYFFYCCFTGAILFFWNIFASPIKLHFYKMLLPSLLSFVLFSFLLCGPLVLELLQLNNPNDPLLRSHRGSQYSMNLLQPFIPGAYWRFSSITKEFWSKLPSNDVENSVYIGWMVIAMFFLVIKSKEPPPSSFNKIIFLLVIFLFLSLGTHISFAGRTFESNFLPYNLMLAALPVLKISGMPIRMMVMVSLFSALIFAFGMKVLIRTKKHIFALIVIVLTIVELLPRQITTTSLMVPRYVSYLSQLKESGGVIDLNANATEQLYFQTIHSRPIAFGYVSRVPYSVDEIDDKIKAYIKNHSYQQLSIEYDFRYLVTSSYINYSVSGCKLVFSENNIFIYDISLCSTDACLK